MALGPPQTLLGPPDCSDTLPVQAPQKRLLQCFQVSGVNVPPLESFIYKRVSILFTEVASPFWLLVLTWRGLIRLRVFCEKGCGLYAAGKNRIIVPM